MPCSRFPVLRLFHASTGCCSSAVAAPVSSTIPPLPRILPWPPVGSEHGLRSCSSAVRVLLAVCSTSCPLSLLRPSPPVAIDSFYRNHFFPNQPFVTGKSLFSGGGMARDTAGHLMVVLMVKDRGLPLVCRFDPGTHLTDESERTLDLPRRRSRQGKSPWLSTEQLWVRSKRQRRGPV